MTSKILRALTLFFFINSAFAGTKTYNLKLESNSVTLANSTLKNALTINGSIPAPTLEFNVGDTAVINITNNTKELSSLHWHGVLVPWNMDGPMFSNNPPIKPGQTYTFQFPIKHSGTYWYHSHTALQEQRGLYGAIVIRNKNEKKYSEEHVLVLSDWTHENPHNVLRNLKVNEHYYSYKKRYFPSWIDAISRNSLGSYIGGQWSRMGAMDPSDAGYDAFLINGKDKSFISKHINPGTEIKLRIINAGASTHFYINIGNNRPFLVVAKDGMPISPIETKEIFLGMGETYDIVFTYPADGMKMYELRSTAFDNSGHASFFVGHGASENVSDKETAPMDHSMHQMHAENQTKTTFKAMEYKKVDRLNYSDLRSPISTSLEAHHAKVQTAKLELNGDMRRYNWSINGEAINKDSQIVVQKGDIVQFTMVNKTMMNHPMHLHGHFFRILNGQGDNAPLAHTVDVKAMETVTIEFKANEPGIWFFHCHNLYHMKMGMSAFLKYEKFQKPEELIQAQKKYASRFQNKNSWFWGGEMGAYTNYAEIGIKANGGSLSLELNGDILKYENEDIESEGKLHYFLSKYFSLFTGAEYHHEEYSGILGFSYFLPMEIDLEAFVNHRQEAEIVFSKEFPIYRTLHWTPMATWRFSEDFKDNYWELEDFLMLQVSSNVEIGGYHNWDVESNEHSVGFGLHAFY